MFITSRFNTILSIQYTCMNQNQAELLCSHQNYFTLTWVGINLVGSDYEALHMQNLTAKWKIQMQSSISTFHRTSSQKDINIGNYNMINYHRTHWTLQNIIQAFFRLHLQHLHNRGLQLYSTTQNSLEGLVLNQQQNLP